MSAMKKSPIALRSNLAAAALLAVGVSTLVYLVYAVRGLGMIDDLQAGTVDLDRYLAYFERFERIEYIQIGSWVLTAILLAFWMPAALRNARELGAQGMRFRYGWPWFLVPFANWFVPYQAMKELWQASHAGPQEATTWPSRPVSWLLPSWWTCWVVISILHMVLRSKDEPTNLDEAVSLLHGGIAHAAFLIGYLVFTLIVVRTIAAAQAERVHDEMPAARVVS